MADVTPEMLSIGNAAYWATRHQIRLTSGLFTFDGHEYQSEPMMSRSRRQVFMKATGGGFSEIKVLGTIHGMIHGRYPQGALYLFPTAEDVQDFSKARFGPLIAANGDAIGRFVKSAGGKSSTDTASLKRIGDGFLYLRGARLTQAIEDGNPEKEASKLRGIQVDVVVFDEVSLMDEGAIAKALGRMGASKLKEEIYISNPGVPGDTHDQLFHASDQRYWFRRCGCGRWFSADEEFPDCVGVGLDGRGFIKCRKCGNAVPFWAGDGTGQWVAKVLMNYNDPLAMVGYHWSHLTSLTNDPAEILRAFQNPPQGNLSDVYRIHLGIPHLSSAEQLTPTDVRACCGQEFMPNSSTGPCAMGVDVGDIKHVLIGQRTGKDSYKLLKACKLSSWVEIAQLAYRFGVKAAVVDLRPSADAVREFRRENRFATYMAEYTETPTVAADYNTDSGIVKVYRTGICDTTHRLFMDRRVVLPRRSPEVDDLIAQMCNLVKVLDTNKKTGVSVHRYRAVGSGGDHFRHALNYFVLAANLTPIHRSVSGFRQTQTANAGSWSPF